MLQIQTCANEGRPFQRVLPWLLSRLQSLAWLRAAAGDVLWGFTDAVPGWECADESGWVGCAWEWLCCPCAATAGDSTMACILQIPLRVVADKTSQLHAVVHRTCLFVLCCRGHLHFSLSRATISGKSSPAGVRLRAVILNMGH